MGLRSAAPILTFSYTASFGGNYASLLPQVPRPPRHRRRRTSHPQEWPTRHTRQVRGVQSDSIQDWKSHLAPVLPRFISDRSVTIPDAEARHSSARHRIRNPTLSITLLSGLLSEARTHCSGLPRWRLLRIARCTADEAPAVSGAELS